MPFTQKQGYPILTSDIELLKKIFTTKCKSFLFIYLFIYSNYCERYPFQYHCRYKTWQRQKTWSVIFSKFARRHCAT